MNGLAYADILEAAERIQGRVRPAAVANIGRHPGSEADLFLALEFLQHTGTFKARGAQNFLLAHREAGTLTDAGVTIASGGNAGLACAWAAWEQGVTATVFLPANAPAVKVQRLRKYGADVRLVGSEYAEALAACEEFAATNGALMSHAYDHTFIAAGAGTLMLELQQQIPDLDTVILAVGGGGLFSGISVVAQHVGVNVVAVEPENCSALHAALEAGHPVDVTLDSIAADSLGARRVSEMALHAAQRPHVQSILVPDDEIVRARNEMWGEYRLTVEHAAGTALAGLISPNGYQASPGEKVCVVLCGANTDPTSLS